jgi:isoleucyl-tRNA synthetase
VNQPGESKLFSEKEVLSLSRNLFLTLWNVYSFFMTYASIDKFTPKGELSSENVLDRWVLAKYNQLVKKVTDSLDKYDPYQASMAVVDFVTELSTWYVRRSRRRFWKSENDLDKSFAYETLFAVLTGLSKLIAPFSPMYAEHLYLGLKQDSDPQSVHLADFPVAKDIDEKIIDDMDLARKVVEAGLAARAEAKIKVRQPLSLLKYFGQKLSSDYEAIIAEEVNVKKVERLAEKSDKVVELDTEISEKLKIEGLARELIRNIQDLRKKTGLQVEDRIILYYRTNSSLLKKVIQEKGEAIKKEILANNIVGLTESGVDYKIGQDIISLRVETN